ncbi:hypothetical protein [Haladaptatus sp. NG-WS-4]
MVRLRARDERSEEAGEDEGRWRVRGGDCRLGGLKGAAVWTKADEAPASERT